MLKNKKMLALLIIEVCLVIFTIVLLLSSFGEYAIITCALIIFVFLFIYTEYKEITSTEKTAYDNKVDKIIKTYNPIVISTNELPNLKDKSVLPIDKIEDLLDAQAEIREPIYYIRKDKSTIFFIINNESVLYTFIKIEGIGETDLEREFQARRDGINLNSIKDIDHTIVVHSDDKSFSITPIDKEEKQDDDEDFKTIPLNIDDVKKADKEQDDEDFKTVPIKVHEIKEEMNQEEDEDFKTVPIKVHEIKEEMNQEEDEDFKTVPIKVHEIKEEMNQEDDEDFKTVPLELSDDIKPDDNEDKELEIISVEDEKEESDNDEII